MQKKLFALFVSLSFIGLPINVSLAQDTVAPATEEVLVKSGLPQTNGQVGTSTSCFDFYKFGSVELDMTKNLEEYSPNDPVIINGTVKNKNNYPLINTTVLARVIKNHPKPTETGAVLTVAENIVLENVTFAANESKNVSTSWILPSTATEGDYQILFYVFSNDRFNMAGLTFTDDIYASRLTFKVKGSKKEQIYLDQGNIKINNKAHQVIGFSTSHEKDKPVNVSLPLVNATNKDQTIEVKYSLYNWDTLLQKNLLRVNKESIQLKANSTKNIAYNIASATDPVYTLKMTATSPDSQPSISNIRFTVRDTSRARFNFIGIDKFPISSGDKINLYSCIHNTNFGTTADGTTMRVLMKDDKGTILSSVYYEGDIPSDINALKSEFTSKKRYNKVTLEAQLFDKDKKVVDSLTIPYDCKDIDGGKQCLSVLNDNGVLDSQKSAALLGFSSLAVLIGVGGFYLNNKRKIKR